MLSCFFGYLRNKLCIETKKRKVDDGLLQAKDNVVAACCEKVSSSISLPFRIRACEFRNYFTKPRKKFFDEIWNCIQYIQNCFSWKELSGSDCTVWCKYCLKHNNKYFVFSNDIILFVFFVIIIVKTAYITWFSFS